MTVRTREPFASISTAPGLFVSGVAIIALVVTALTVLFYERNFGLSIGLAAGFQGAAYMWLLKLCRARSKGRSAAPALMPSKPNR